MAARPRGSVVRRSGPTPGGGDYSLAYFYNNKRQLVDRSRAEAVEIAEFDAVGNMLQRTYARIGARNR
jgi:hypothetical protein